MMIHPVGYVTSVPSDHTSPRPERTAAAMRRTADELEEAEDALHRGAEDSPDAAATGRLHALGDRVTARAHDIARRADDLDHGPPASGG